MPHWIRRADGYPLVFAALWTTWSDPRTRQQVRTCALLTRPAAGAVAPLHDRMPVILRPDAWEPWLDRTLRDADAVAALTELVEPPDLLVATEVAPLVNSVRNNGPELLALPDRIL